MSGSRLNHLGGALLCALAVTALVPAIASATTGADLRVVTTDGRSLADVRQYTDTTSIPTSPAARCFAGSVGGSGKPKAVHGPTALGIVADAAQSVPSLRPLLVTDEFSFGLGLCGIGGISSGPNNFWQVRVNHVASQVGGDQTVLGSGDEVLWALVPNPVCDFNPPYACQPTAPELSLSAPARARPGQPIAVKVTEFSDTGVARPAAGVTVTDAAQPTDALGDASVTLDRSTTLVGSRSGAIPSQQLQVCVSRKLHKCASHRGLTILGSPHGDDVIRGTGGNDRIFAGAGNDVILVRGGGRDTVECGSGHDIVIADRHDKVAKNCAVVSRKGLKRRKK